MSGSVYQATDLSSDGKMVAIKILNPIGYKLSPVGVSLFRGSICVLVFYAYM